MQTVRFDEKDTKTDANDHSLLSAQELLAGSLLSYEVVVPAEVLRSDGESDPGKVRLRPLKVATLALIAKASREDPSLIPLLMIKDSLLEPSLSLDQIRSMHVGLVHFLVAQINRISGLSDDAQGYTHSSPITDTHVLLAQHFGWTPAQVAELTPGQVALYLAGVERMLATAEQHKES